MTKLLRPSRSKYLTVFAHLGALLTMGAWGTSFLSTKVLMIDGGFTPVEMFVYRFANGIFAFVAFYIKKNII